MPNGLLNVVLAFCALGSAAGVIFIVRILRQVNNLRNRLTERVFLEDQPEVPKELPRESWAEFEGSISNLKQVIVVSDVVEKPADGLLKAVQTNFARGVRYSFIVSHSKAVQERDGWIHIFQALAKIAIRDFKLNKRPEDLVQILALPDDWDNPPFVFYRSEEPQDRLGGRGLLRRTIAFRGDQKNVGIAEKYIAIDPFVGDALATALNSGAPADIQKEIRSFQDDEFSDTLSSKRAIFHN